MCRKFVTVTQKNYPQMIENLKKTNATKALIVNLRKTPDKIKNNLDSFGCCGYDLTKNASREAAINTLKGLMSIPENCGNILCELA